MNPIINPQVLGRGLSVAFEAPVSVSGAQGYVSGLPSVTFATAATDAFAGGSKYSYDGRLVCVDATSALPSGAVVLGGFAFSETGALCITTGAQSSAVFIQGIPVRQDGAVHISMGFAFDFLQQANPLMPSGSSLTLSVSANRTFIASTGVVTLQTSNVWPLSYNPQTLVARGRPSWVGATNLILQSETLDNASWLKTRSSVTANAVVSPDGSTDADKMVEDSTNNSHYNEQSITKAASALSYVYSVFLKAAERGFFRIQVLDGASNGAFADLNISTGTISAASGIGGTPFTSLSTFIEAYQNGWYRANLIFTTGTNTTLTCFNVMANSLGGVSYQGDGTSGLYAWGSELKQQSFTSPYIPTVASSVTAPADTASMALPSSFNASEGTCYIEFIPSVTQTTAPVVVSFDDGTNNERIQVYLTSGNVPSLFVVDGGVTQADITNSSAATNFAVTKVAFRYKANDFAICVNGGTVRTDTSGTLPTVTTIRFNGVAGQQLNGWLRKCYYYPVALTNAELVSLTT